MSAQITTAALIVAAGRGARVGQGLPKQYRPLPGGHGETVLAATITALATHPQVEAVCVVIHEDDKQLYENISKHLNFNTKIIYSFGGATRQNSVLNGLQALADLQPQQVLIHDAARPFVSGALISRCLTGLGSAAGAIPALQVSDTLKRVEKDTITETVSRDGLWQAQTPQAFRFDAILAAHLNAPPGLTDLTDDAAVAEMAGLSLAIVAGDACNIKLTHAEDFAPPPPQRIPRMGCGFDVHRFAAAGTAESIMLGGIAIAHNCALIGHSDADVALHAITDGLLGALAEGDIGTHFPPSDADNKNRPSADFLTHAVQLAHSKQARLTHIDLTLICELPQISPHRNAMRACIAELCGLDICCVSVKATTTEGLGFTGRGEGIAAQALVSVMMPETVKC